MTLGHDRTSASGILFTGKEIRRFDAGDVGIRFAALSADGKTLATGGGYQPTRLWDVAAGRELRRLQMPSKNSDGLVNCADLSPDGKTLAAAVSNRLIFWDTVTGERRAGVAESGSAARSSKLCGSRPTASRSPRSTATRSGSGMSVGQGDAPDHPSRHRSKRWLRNTAPARYRPTARSWRRQASATA